MEKRRKELEDIEGKYREINDEEENEGLKILIKQAGKYKKEVTFAKLDNVAMYSSIQFLLV